MLRFDNVTLKLPQISQGEWAKYVYFIITENQVFNANFDTFIFIPDLGSHKNFVTCLKVERHETNALKIIEEDGIPMVIPDHYVEDGTPIFTRRSLDGCYEWEHPENFFWTYSQAQSMLEYIKQKCGYTTKFSKDKYNLISPVGHFNNINKRH